MLKEMRVGKPVDLFAEKTTSETVRSSDIRISGVYKVPSNNETADNSDCKYDYLFRLATCTFFNNRELFTSSDITNRSPKDMYSVLIPNSGYIAAVTLDNKKTYGRAVDKVLNGRLVDMAFEYRIYGISIKDAKAYGQNYRIISLRHKLSNVKFINLTNSILGTNGIMDRYDTIEIPENVIESIDGLRTFDIETKPNFNIDLSLLGNSQLLNHIKQASGTGFTIYVPISEYDYVMNLANKDLCDQIRYLSELYGQACKSKIYENAPFLNSLKDNAVAFIENYYGGNVSGSTTLVSIGKDTMDNAKVYTYYRNLVGSTSAAYLDIINDGFSIRTRLEMKSIDTIMEDRTKSSLVDSYASTDALNALGMEQFIATMNMKYRDPMVFYVANKEEIKNIERVCKIERYDIPKIDKEHNTVTVDLPPYITEMNELDISRFIRHMFFSKHSLSNPLYSVSKDSKPENSTDLFMLLLKSSGTSLGELLDLYVSDTVTLDDGYTLVYAKAKFAMLGDLSDITKLYEDLESKKKKIVNVNLVDVAQDWTKFNYVYVQDKYACDITVSGRKINTPFSARFIVTDYL